MAELPDLQAGNAGSWFENHKISSGRLVLPTDVWYGYQKLSEDNL
jgi:hypothetical protein